MASKSEKAPRLSRVATSTLGLAKDMIYGWFTSRKTSSISDAPDAETMSIILDCFNRRLLKAGFYWAPQNTCLSPKETKLLRVVRRVCDEYEEAFRHRFSDIQNYEVKVDSTNAEAHFRECMDSLFSDRVKQYSWGRIIGMMVYSSMLAVQAMTLNKPHLVMEVVDWVASYMNTEDMRDFLVQEGGWSGFRMKFDSPRNKLDGLLGEPSMLGLTVAGAAICGAILVAKLLTI